MRVFPTITLFFATTIPALFFACATDNMHRRTERDYHGITCPSQPYVVDLIVPLEQRAFCAKDKEFCFDALAQLHLADKKETFTFLVLDRTHRTSMTEIEQILSDAHNAKQTVKMNYIPENGKQCDASIPIVLEKDIASIELVK